MPMSGGRNAFPRSRSVRVEVYLPFRFEPSYQQTRAWLTNEFTALFGGCSVVENIQGWYRARDGSTVEDPTTVIYSDTPELVAQDHRTLRTHLRDLGRFIEIFLSEESVFIAFWPVEHAVTR